MPEGDTIYKVATMLQKALAGAELQRLETRGDRVMFPHTRLSVLGVSAIGKHCLIDLSNEVTIRVHLGMYGSWQRYKIPWKRSGEIHLILESGGEAFVCSQPKDVEFFPTKDKKRHRILNALGPDLLGPPPEWERIGARVLLHSGTDRTLGETLLDQRIACGLGNVYKNELCYMGALRERPWVPDRGTSPYTPLHDLEHEWLLDVFRRGRELMLLNLGGWMRTTAFDPRRVAVDSPLPRTFVYGGTGKQCRRCRTRILSRPQGLEARPTHWCPTCQPLGKLGPPYRRTH